MEQTRLSFAAEVADTGTETGSTRMANGAHGTPVAVGGTRDGDAVMNFLYCNHGQMDQTLSRLLCIDDELRDRQNRELSYNNGKWRADRGGPAQVELNIDTPRAHAEAAIRIIVAVQGEYLSADEPFGNGQLACGARFHCALPPISNEPQISIRLHYGMGNIHLRDFATPTQVELIKDTIGQQRTLIIGGATSSGKSTMMNAIVDELIPLAARIILVEDVFELAPDPLRNVVRRIAHGKADLKRHLFEALRDRPDWLCLSEARDHSARDLLDAARSGHPGISTLHANSANGVLTRLMSLANCDSQFVNEALDLVVYVSRCPNGERRITEMLVKRPDMTWDTCGM